MAYTLDRRAMEERRRITGAYAPDSAVNAGIPAGRLSAGTPGVQPGGHVNLATYLDLNKGQGAGMAGQIANAGGLGELKALDGQEQMVERPSFGAKPAPAATSQLGEPAARTPAPASQPTRLFPEPAASATAATSPFPSQTPLQGESRFGAAPTPAITPQAPTTYRTSAKGLTLSSSGAQPVAVGTANPVLQANAGPEVFQAAADKAVGLGSKAQLLKNIEGQSDLAKEAFGRGGAYSQGMGLYDAALARQHEGGKYKQTMGLAEFLGKSLPARAEAAQSAQAASALAAESEAARRKREQDQALASGMASTLGSLQPVQGAPVQAAGDVLGADATSPTKRRLERWGF
jgi:hypothetical protein